MTEEEKLKKLLDAYTIALRAWQIDIPGNARLIDNMHKTSQAYLNHLWTISRDD